MTRNNINDDLKLRLEALRSQGLHRELRKVNSAQGPRIQLGDRSFLNFSSNDYLGLANHPQLKESAIRAIEQFGAGAGASRLISGSLSPHQALDEALAEFKRAEAALGFSTGYAAAIGTICALVAKEDIIVMDKLVHACIVDAAKLSGAKLRVFAHNDLNDLEKILKWADAKVRAANSKARILIITESVFSMDGDQAPLREIVALKEKHGAWLMLDEAHATGLFGARGRGLADEMGVSRQIEVQMGTLGKAVGASGGFISGSRVLIDFLINRARSFIFSTAPVPAAAAAAKAGIELIQSPEGDERRRKVWQLANGLRSALSSIPPSIAPGNRLILPLIVGDESKAMELAARLRERGTFIPAIRYPTVARGSARLRITLTAAHSELSLIHI